MLSVIFSLLLASRNKSSVRQVIAPCNFHFDSQLSDTTQCFTGAKIDIWKYCLSGAVAGGCRAVSRVFTFPLDTIKTLKQMDISVNDGTKGKNYYSGLLPATLSAVPSSAVFFLAYNALQVYYNSCFLQDTHQLEAARLVQKILISSIATVPQNAIKVPAEALKQYLQYTNEKSSRLIVSTQTLKRVLKISKWKALYTSSNAQLMRDVPYNALQMAFYDTLQESSTVHISPQFADWLLHLYTIVTGQIVTSEVIVVDVMSNTLSAAVLGCLAACFAAVLTQPADVVKTKMTIPTMLTVSRNMIHSTEGKREFGTAVHSLKRSNTTIKRTQTTNSVFLESLAINSKTQEKTPSIGETVRQIWLQEGISGYFVGLIPRLLIVSVGGAVYFLATALVEYWF